MSIERDFQAGCRLAAELRAAGLVPVEVSDGEKLVRPAPADERARLVAALRGAGVTMRDAKTRRVGARMLEVTWVPYWVPAFWASGGVGIDPPGRDRVLQFLEADRDAAAALDAVAMLDGHGGFELLLRYLADTTPPGDEMSFTAPDGSCGGGTGGVGFEPADGFPGGMAHQALRLRP